MPDDAPKITPKEVADHVLVKIDEIVRAGVKEDVEDNGYGVKVPRSNIIEMEKMIDIYIKVLSCIIHKGGVTAARSCQRE